MTDPCPAKEHAKAIHDSKSEDTRSLGEVGFDFYSETKGGLTFDGRKIPPFRECGPDVQHAWDMAAAMLVELGRLKGYDEGYADGEEDGKDDCCPPESARMSDRTLG